MRTRADLIARVLKNLGVLAAGQSPSDEDRAEVDDLIEPVCAKLLDDGVAKLNGDLIDDAAYLPLAAILSEAAMVPFGIAGAKANDLVALAERARTDLRLAYRVYDARRPMRIERFWARHGGSAPIVQVSSLFAPSAPAPTPGGGSTGGGSTGGGSTGGSGGSTGGSTGGNTGGSTGGSTGGGTTTPTQDPAVTAAAAQSQSRQTEASAASGDTGRSGSGAGPYTALGRPTISGKPLVGQTLIGYPGLWDPAAGLTYAWRVGGSAGTIVSGATSRLFTGQAAQAGQTIEFGVIPNNGTPAWSQPVTLVAAFPALTTESGAALTTESGAPIDLNDRVIRWLAPYSASQTRADKLAATGTTAYGYAVSDADIFVAPISLPISLYAPGCKIVNIWHSGAVQLSLVADADGYCQGVVPLTGLPNGPLWIEARAMVDSTTEALATSALYAGINVIVRGGAAPVIPATPPPAAGLTLAFSDEFASALSASQANSRPSGVKWYGSQAFDKNGYGDAIFADPNGAANPYSIVDGLLRIRCSYNPTLAATLNDPYNRKWIGGCLTSSFPDGSTSLPGMGDGYYETRMLCPVGIGTWPAFWLNDQSSLLLKAAGTPSPNGRETDIVEQYNETPGYVATQHRYQLNGSGQAIDQPSGFNVAGDKGRMGWAWHRFGCRMDSANNRIVYYLDDQVVATDTSFYKPAGQSNPTLNHIILTMAMNGGWPVAVPPSGYYDLYVDYVRYWQ